MLKDLMNLLSTDNYVSYNIKIAEVFGLHTAVYLTEIININNKAIDKDKLDNDYFTLDRKYITKRTTISEEEQLDIEKKLLEVEVLKKEDNLSNKMKLDIDALTTIMTSGTKLQTDVSSIVKKKTKKTKEEAILANLRSNITTSNPKLRDAYTRWIDSVIGKEGRMSVDAVIKGQRIINQYSCNREDIALGIIEIASIGGYRDMEWALERFSEEYTKRQAMVITTNTTINNNQNIVFCDNEVY